MEKVKVFTREFFSDPLDAEYVYSVRQQRNGPVANHQLSVSKSELSDSLFKGIDYKRAVSFSVIGSNDGYSDYYFVHDTDDSYVFQTNPA